MKEPLLVSVADALARPGDFDTIVDARSPSEFAEDHLPGAISAPVLDDEQRARVGTMYGASAFEARRVGAALAARAIAEHLETTFAQRDKSWRPLVYCWRGGQRSGSLSTVMARVGWRTSVLDGGYRAFRRHVLAELESLPARLRLIVVAGRTGSAKSRLLHRLQAAGEQVLDLEGLASHRGSVLGGLPDAPQPSQRRFETMIWDVLRGFDPTRPVFVESESRKVGRCHVPERLIGAIRAGECVRIEAELPVRSRFLLDEYAHFRDDVPNLLRLIDCLLPLHGEQVVAEWRELVTADRWLELVERLLVEHYDPAYERSMKRNFERLGRAPAVVLAGTDDAALEAAARRVATVVGPLAGAIG